MKKIKLLSLLATVPTLASVPIATTSCSDDNTIKEGDSSKIIGSRYLVEDISEDPSNPTISVYQLSGATDPYDVEWEVYGEPSNIFILEYAGILGFVLIDGTQPDTFTFAIKATYKNTIYKDTVTVIKKTK